MLHYVRHVVANCVCLLFGAEHLVLLASRMFHCEQLPATIRAVRGNQNSEFVDRTYPQRAETRFRDSLDLGSGDRLLLSVCILFCHFVCKHVHIMLIIV